MKKILWPNFSPTIGCDKTSRDIFEGSKRISNFYCGSYGINYVTPKGACWKHKFLKKRQSLQWKKICGLFFLILSRVTNLTGQIKRSKKYFNFYCGSYNFVSVTPKEVVENTNFKRKKATFPVKKRLWPIFCHIIECDKLHGTIYKGAKGILTITVEVIRSFL